MKVTNKSEALQGVWFSGELIWIKPGESHDGDMTDAEHKLIESNDLLDAPKVAGKTSVKS